ncbi:MAG: hypothetical protein ACK4K9_07450 [Bacteroidia bacterium]
MMIQGLLYIQHSSAKIISFIVIAFSTNLCLAQTQINEHKEKDYKIKQNEFAIIEQATKYTNRIFTTTGFTYYAEDLAYMPTRSINKIAGLTLGVNFNGQGTPIIRGAKDGTAYFIDGVRVRSGELSIAGFSW